MPGNYWEQAQAPMGPFGDAFTAAGLQATPGFVPPPSPEEARAAQEAAAINTLQTSSVPISLGGRFPVPGQPIPMPGAPAGMPEPLPEVSLQRGNPNAAGPISRGMGIGLKVGMTPEEVAEGMEGAREFQTRVGHVGRPDENLGNMALGLMHSANAEKAAADRATAGVAEKGAAELAKIAEGREKIYKGAAGREADAAANMETQLDETRTKMNEDSEWVRTHSRVDPYRTFRTNGGAAIMALLGTALMAGGAIAGRDSSLKWTQQVDKMLDREADEQLRMLQNKKWSVTEAGQNMKRIAQTSADEYEARARFRMQGIQALNERAEAIKNTTESNSVRSRAEALIAENTRKLGEEMANIAIRREAMRSGESVADVQARVTMRGQDTGLYGQLYGDQSRFNLAQRQAEREAYKPIRDERNKLKQAHGAFNAAGMALKAALDRHADASELNPLAQAFAETGQQFYAGTGGGGKNAATYGFSVNPKEWLAKIRTQKNSKDVAQMLTAAQRAYNDRVEYLLDQQDKYPTALPPPNSVYSSGR